jgi:hypothetical protein
MLRLVYRTAGPVANGWGEPREAVETEVVVQQADMPTCALHHRQEGAFVGMEGALSNRH